MHMFQILRCCNFSDTTVVFLTSLGCFSEEIPSNNTGTESQPYSAYQSRWTEYFGYNNLITFDNLITLPTILCLRHSPYSNNCNRELCETHVSNYVSFTSKSVSTKTVCKSILIMSCNKPVIFSPVYKSLHASKICIVKTVRCSVSTKPVSALIICYV